jgi:5'-3' exonuclease
MPWCNSPPKVTIALVDADVLVYRIGFTTEEVDSNIAIWRLKTTLEDIVDATEADAYRCFLTSEDKSNYRFDIDPLYKSNRKAEKPRHYHALRSHLITQHQAEVVFGMEADDRLGIEQQEDTILCSIDKDMKQIPGKHYNFVKKEFFEVTPVEALQFFYKQILMGDTADFIEGIRGIGPKKADKIIAPFLTEQEMFDAVMAVYKKHYPEDAFTRVVKAGQLLKIKQSKEEELWRPPVNNDTAPVLSEPLPIS